MLATREQNYVDAADHFGTDIYEGFGRVVEDTAIEVVDGEDAGTTITGERLLVATGSSPHSAPSDGIETVGYETGSVSLAGESEDEEVEAILDADYPSADD